ncbi:hypothetical protein [Reyranella sp.]|uniref:hypothetical protein n=1 Tax=Reyranella sp. TaxID=1929291 RepID=UPI003D0F05FD
MTDLTEMGAAVWRDYVTPNVPSSGAREPPKSDVRAWAAALSAAVGPLATVAAAASIALAPVQRVVVERHSADAPYAPASYVRVAEQPVRQAGFETAGWFPALDGGYFEIEKSPRGYLTADQLGGNVAGFQRALSITGLVEMTPYSVVDDVERGVYEFAQASDFVEIFDPDDEDIVSMVEGSTVIRQRNVHIAGRYSVLRKSITGDGPCIVGVGTWEEPQAVSAIGDPDGRYSTVTIDDGSKYKLDDFCKVIADDLDADLSGNVPGVGEWVGVRTITDDVVQLSGRLERYGIYATNIQMARLARANSWRCEIGKIEFAPGVTGAGILAESFHEPYTWIGSSPRWSPGTSIAASHRACVGGDLDVDYGGGGDELGSYITRLSGCYGSRTMVKNSTGGRHPIDMGSRTTCYSKFASYGANYYCVGHDSIVVGARVAPFTFHHNTVGCYFERCQARNCDGSGLSLRGIRNGARDCVIESCATGIAGFKQTDDDGEVFGVSDGIWFENIIVKNPRFGFVSNKAGSMRVSRCTFESDVAGPDTDDMIEIDLLGTELILEDCRFKYSNPGRVIKNQVIRNITMEKLTMRNVEFDFRGADLLGNLVLLNIPVDTSPDVRIDNVIVKADEDIAIFKRLGTLDAKSTIGAMTLPPGSVIDRDHDESEYAAFVHGPVFFGHTSMVGITRGWKMAFDPGKVLTLPIPAGAHHMSIVTYTQDAPSPNGILKLVAHTVDATVLKWLLVEDDDDADFTLTTDAVLTEDDGSSPTGKFLISLDNSAHSSVATMYLKNKSDHRIVFSANIPVSTGRPI